MKRLMLMVAMAAALVGCGQKQGEPLKMVTEAAFPPYEYMRGQEIVGIDIEICRAVADKLGRPFKCETLDFGSVIPSVVSGKADIAAAGITITEERKQEVDFSVPYAITGIVVIYKKSNPFSEKNPLKGKRIGVQGGTTSETFVLEHLKQKPERYQSPLEAVAALKAGRVDFVIADIDPAKACVKGNSELAISDFVSSEEYAVAIRKGQPELLKVINDTIAEIKRDGRLEGWIVEFTKESNALKGK